jgi:large subunit ribosomal protein L20
MTRVKRGNVARRRRNKILKIAKGFRGSSSTLFRTANQRVLKSLSASHRDRFQRRRDFRSLWITRINAAVRLQGIKYSDFIFSLRKLNMFLNRKVLAQLASRDEKAFQRLVDLIQEAINSSIQYPLSKTL